jgi:hypothetical protein
MGLLTVGGIQIDVGANTAPLKNDLANAQRELESFGRLMGSSGGSSTGLGAPFAQASQQASGFFSTVKAGAQDFLVMSGAAYAAYKGVAAVAGQAYDVAQLGWEAERARIALTNMLGGDSTQYEAWIGAVKTATHGLVTEAEAAQLSYQALRLGLADSAGDAQEFVRIAAIVGAASPQLQGTADAMTEISLTIANMSWRRLDQLGLSVSDVKGRYQELQATMSNEEAFKVAVLEGLAEQADTLGDAILTVGGNTEQLKVRLSEIKTDVGYQLGEGFEWASGQILAAMDALSGANAQPYSNPGASADTVGGLQQMVEMYSPYSAQYMYGTGRDYAAETAAVRRALGLPVYTPGEWARMRAEQQAEIDSFNRMYDSMINGPQRQNMQAFNTVWSLSPDELPSWFSYFNQMEPGLAQETGLSELLRRWEMVTNYAQRQQTAQYKADRLGPSSMGLLDEARGALTNEAWRVTLDVGAIPPERVEAIRASVADAVTLDAEAMRRVGRSVESAVSGDGTRAAFSDALRTAAGDTGIGDALGGQIKQAGGILVQAAQDAAAQWQVSISDSEMYSTVIGMMEDLGVKEQVALGIQEQLQLSLGDTTPGMELFTGLLETQTQRLADGQIDAQTYMDQLARIQDLDFSKLNQLFQPLMDAGKYDSVLALLDRLEKFTNPDMAIYGAQYAMSGGDSGPRRGGAELGGGSTSVATSGVPSWLSDTMNTVQDIGASLEGAQVTWPSYIATFREQGTAEMETFAADSLTQVGYVEAALSALDGSTITVTLDVIAPGSIVIPMTGGPQPEPETPPQINRPWNIPQGGRAGGGAIGAGLWEVNEQQMEAVTSGGRTMLIMPQGRTGTVTPVAGGGGGGAVVNFYGDMVFPNATNGQQAYDEFVAELRRRNVRIPGVTV